MCTGEDALAYNLGALSIDDTMSYNSLTTKALKNLNGKHQETTFTF